MTLEHVVVVLLAAAALIGILETRRLTGARRLAGLAAAIAAPALLYFVLFPPARPLQPVPLRVLTAGTAATPRVAAMTVALPGSDAPAGVERVPDLATALRRHPAAGVIEVIGAGLAASDRDALRGRSLRFDAAALPRGIVAIDLPGEVRPGHTFHVSGSVAQPEGLRIAWHEPGGDRREPVALAADGRFSFAAFAPRAGDVNYALSLLDANGAEIERVTVPVSVRDGVALRLLLLAGGPDPDLKYLQRWALDAGHTVDARISLSRGIAQRRGDASLTDAALAATDAVIIDERAWSALDTATRVRLLSAVDAGLGLLLRLGSMPSAALVAQWRELGLPLESADLAPAVRLPGEAGDAASAVRRLPLRAVGSDGIALARDSGSTALAVARNRGQGRLGVWWLYDTRTLVSGGEGALHDALWANAIDRLARPRQTAPPTAPPHAWEHERNDLCAREADVHVDAPSGETTVVLTQRGTDGQWCGGFWPREPGWHAVRTGTARTHFYVRAAGEAVALHRAQMAVATRALAGEVAVPTPVPVPGPRWPWFLAWLVPATMLWWLQRSRSRQAG